MLKQNFAIVISKYYASRCAALIESIIKYNVNIYILCFDIHTSKLLFKFKNSNKVTIINYDEINKFDKSLKKIIKKRKLIDKIVTSRPIFLQYLNQKYFINNIFLLDSDIYFFSNPEKLNNHIKGFSVAFCEHKFTRNNLELSNKYGKYNGGFVYAKFDRNGKFFLKKWSKLCKKWCEFDSKDGKFSDQKYLENLSLETKNIKIINSPDINLAPWNLEGKNIQLKNNKILVNNKKLIFFHFHGLRQIRKNFYILGLENYKYIISNKNKKILFKNYVTKLRNNNSTNEYFWTKNHYFSLLLKIPILIRKLFYNDYIIL